VKLVGRFIDRIGVRLHLVSGHTYRPKKNLYREFQAICRGAGLGDWHPHELRHSAASLMLAQGVKIQIVSQVLGHSSIRVTADVDGHILDPDRKGAADPIGSMLWNTEGA
jgi:integrase